MLSGKEGFRVNNTELGVEEWLGGGESRGCCHPFPLSDAVTNVFPELRR